MYVKGHANGYINLSTLFTWGGNSITNNAKVNANARENVPEKPDDIY